MTYRRARQVQHNGNGCKLEFDLMEFEVVSCTGLPLWLHFDSCTTLWGAGRCGCDLPKWLDDTALWLIGSMDGGRELDDLGRSRR